MLVAQVAFAAMVISPVVGILLLAGFWLFFRNRRNRFLRACGAVSVLLAFAIVGQLVRAHFHWEDVWDGLDVNPDVSEEEIVGDWRTADAAVTFFPDNTFALHGARELRGKWQLNVAGASAETVRSSGGLAVGPEYWHAVKKRGELRLVRNAPTLDWDEWNGNLGFRRVGGADR